MNYKTDFIDKLKALSNLASKIKERKTNLYVSPLNGSFKTFIIKKLLQEDANILVLLPSKKEVSELNVELNLLGYQDEVFSLPELERDTIQEKLTSITQKEKFVLISTYELVKLELPSKDDLSKSTTKLEIGSDITYDDLLEYLNLLEYRREQYVDVPGDFAVRGSIIDFWSFSENLPCRIEYDGDFLESIRYFDQDNQRSLGKANSVTLAASVNDEDDYTADIFDYLNKPYVFASVRNLEEITENGKLTEPQEEPETKEIDQELKDEIFEGADLSGENRQPETETSKEIDLDTLLSKGGKWIIEDELRGNEETIETKVNQAPPIDSNFDLLFKKLSEISQKDNIVITSENELQSNRLYELLSEYSEELKELFESGRIKIKVLPIKEGFYSKEDNLLILTDYQIFNKPYRTKISRKGKVKKSRVKDLASIKKGDFVVHENYGIGQYDGLETIKIGSVDQESIKILYAEGGVVYVNLNYLSLVKKYSSKDNPHPKLSELGSTEWKKTKKKVKGKIKDAARDLIRLYAKRKATKGIQYNEDTIWQKELEASFLYEDTPDQSKVTDEVKGDMETENPMDRLVCGDVGFGKTEVAVRAAFKVVNDGKQIALLVPTTILAEQHYNTFVDRLSQYPVKVEVISRFQKKSKQNQIVQEASHGLVDVVIGTHRLLSKDIKIPNLGLLIIDEEHRFGVMAKEKLRQLKSNVDTLTLTATPIPRTLNMSLLGARDLSIIATPPPNRQPIHTKAEVFNITKIRGWILQEVRRGGQVYVVHDRVHSIDKIAAYLSKHIPEVNIGIVHGQMKVSQLEKVFHEFLEKKFNVLVSTKIIESGLDIPNVNTIIVNRADRFGMAELHQLRGRVGRSNRQAYAHLLVPSLNTISKKAVKRLQAIEEFTDLGEGFSLSMRDLEIRGAGNLLGTEQSGAIDSVGFDLYMKMLDEAVEELKTEEFSDVFKELPKHFDRTEPKLDAYFEIGIPKGFMPDQADRLSYYTALFSVTKVDEIDEIVEEMEDKFGKLPVNIQRLVLMAKLRYYASFAMFERLVIRKDKVSIILPKSDREEFYQNKFEKLMEFVMQNYYNEIRFHQKKDAMKFEMQNKFNQPVEVMNYLINFSSRVMNLVTKEEKAEIKEEVEN